MGRDYSGGTGSRVTNLTRHYSRLLPYIALVGVLLVMVVWPVASRSAKNEGGAVFVFWAWTNPWQNANPSWFEHRPHSQHETLDACEKRMSRNLDWAKNPSCQKMMPEDALAAARSAWPTIPPRMSLGLDDWNEAKWCKHNALRGWCEDGKITR